MIINFDCECGNTDPKKAHFHDGALGYAAIVCKCCGRYSDHQDKYDADDWSKRFVIKINETV